MDGQQVNVTAPDGKIIRFPAGTPENTIKRVMSDYWKDRGKTSAPSASEGGGLLDSISRVLSSFGEGAAAPFTEGGPIGPSQEFLQRNAYNQEPAFLRPLAAGVYTAGGQVGDLALRAIQAPIEAMARGGGQLVEEVPGLRMGYEPKSANQAFQRDIRGLANAAGFVLAGSPMAAGASMPRSVAPARAPSPIVSAYERAGVDLTSPAVSERAATVARIEGKVPVLGAPISNRAAVSMQQTQEAAQNTALRYGTSAIAEKPAQVAGERVQRGLEGFAGRVPGAPAATASTPTRLVGVEAKAEKLYSDIPIKPETPVELTNTTTALNDITARFGANPALAAEMQNPFFANLSAALNGQPMTWQMLRDLRTRIREMRPGSGSKNEMTRAEYDRLYKGLTADLDAAARAQGGPAYLMWRRANDYYVAATKRTDDALVQFMGSGTGKRIPGETVYSRIIRASQAKGGDIRSLVVLRRSLPDEAWDEVASAALAEMRGTVPERAASTFIANFEKLSPSARHLLFGRNKEGAEALDDLVTVMRGQKNVEPLVKGATAEINLPNIGGASLLGYGFSEPITAGFIATGINGTSRLMMWPPFARWLAGTVRTQRSAIPPPIRALAMKQQMERLRNLAATDAEAQTFYEGMAAATGN